MSRLTAGNLIKVIIAIIFFPLISFLLLLVGIGAKKKNVIIEGGIYSAVFLIALLVPSDIASFIGLISMALSVIRSFILRDLWLPRGALKPKALEPSHIPASKSHATSEEPRPTAFSTVRTQDTLSNVLTGVSSQAKQNKQKLPIDAYVTILETCQVLDSIIDAEQQQPSTDARFEYELEAVVREYLPAVLQGYLAIPLSMVEDRQPNGKTPNEELVEQINLLQAHAEALHATRHQQSSSDLTTTGNFLRERFAHHLQGGFDFGIK
ncbi:hypothetical protein SLW73_05490 [Glutamicibacter protophormiae]|uniref:hypothetical protein n=1 Tax=Glutamicibacter protophormiae TaxID=37930 RepID=UPI002A82FF08|nr:hypothetical protein [Glutamicibacter protophormiae]WPR65777.1 hypothetical protein SLW72_05495 [Glutamicibacter protophormiae]WPR69275.1 hypothetical protein SLW73_05490 [Glutamicibacter protophormiae]